MIYAFTILTEKLKKRGNKLEGNWERGSEKKARDNFLS